MPYPKLSPVLLWAALLIGPLAWGADRPEEVPNSATWYEVERVTDGDTIVLVDGTRVRLHGIDAPERDQPFGSQATAALGYMVGSTVYVLKVDTDRYGRMVGQLYHADKGYDVNASMVCAGFAWWYKRYAKDSGLLNACESEARDESKGLWSDSEPVPPWEWRRR
jgi:endonuclease YncB( thermonuclease family)